MENYLKTLDPAWKNNSREIVRGKLERLKKFPSSKLANEVERMTGVDVDVSDKDLDFFEEQQH